MITEDRVQAWSEFLRWWDSRMKESSGQTGGVEEEAGAAWLAACEWAWSLRDISE